jgi:hypothetical protein
LDELDEIDEPDDEGKFWTVTLNVIILAPSSSPNRVDIIEFSAAFESVIPAALTWKSS